MPRKIKTIVHVKPMMLLPPAPDKCQECAVKHAPTDPHDATSLFYGVKFKMSYDRDPTWEDAMAHCSEEMKALWREQLFKKFKIDTKSTSVRG